MRDSLKTKFVPFLRKIGFKGSMPHFRRHRGDFVDLVSFQFNHREGGSFAVEIGRATKEEVINFEGKIDAFSAFNRHRLGGNFWYTYSRPSFSLKNKYDYLTKILLKDFLIEEDYFISGTQLLPPSLVFNSELLNELSDEEIEWFVYDTVVEGGDINQFSFNNILKLPEAVWATVFTMQAEVSFYRGGLTTLLVFEPQLVKYQIDAYKAIGAHRHAKILDSALVNLKDFDSDPDNLIKTWYHDETFFEKYIKRYHNQFYKLENPTLFSNKEDTSRLRIAALRML
ncbi:DUF4304 domain-containing protein [Patescibacteria group bacterium]|nr:DUF4304 domain-containing protein [Patescibacteria group bacterium]